MKNDNFLPLKDDFVEKTDPTGRTTYSIYAIVPALLVCCVTSAFRGYYEGLRNMYPTAFSDVIESLGKLILGYGFAYIVFIRLWAEDICIIHNHRPPTIYI